jgi:hypothetical protein
MSQRISQAEAEAICAKAIEEHGMPRWVGVVPISVRDAARVEVKRELMASARLSDGWAWQGDRLIFGRPDAREMLRLWASQNVFAIMTVKEIATSAGVSQSAVRTMISERPDILRPSEGRTYEVRNPHDDRKADKR